VASGIAILIGTILMYNLESGAENSRMKTLVDAAPLPPPTTR